MKSSNNKLVVDIIKHYPYNVKKIRIENHKKKKNIWWIHTNKGLKVLKKLPYHENRAKFTLDAIIHLHSKGINIPIIYKTIKNELYVKNDGDCYILMEAIDGSKPLYTDKTELKAIMIEMGKFHRASCGFKSSFERETSNHLGECSKKYTKKYNMLKDYYMEESKKDVHTAFGKIVIKELPYFFKRIEDVQSQLAKSKYPLWVEKVSKSRQLNHSDFEAHNLLITPAKKLYIIDLDGLSVGLPIWDIGQIFFNIMKDIKPFTKQNLETLLTLYQNENPLTADEWHVVKIHLLFPNKLCTTIKRYINKKRDWSEDRFALELKKIIELEKSMIHKLEGYEDIIDKLT